MTDVDTKTEQLRSMMRAYEGPNHAVVAFWLEDGKPTYLNSGKQISSAPCEDWKFEIGSITKVFCAILMCLLVEEGKIDPNAPLNSLDDTLKSVPAWITPERLITHTSGLPSYFLPLWKVLFRSEPDGPYAAFSRSDLMAWFRNRRARGEPSKLRHAYSNLGVGLLGEAMAIMEGTSFVELLQEKIIAPLGLQDTSDHRDFGQDDHFASPRWPNGKAAPAWVFQSLAGAGCLCSTAGDLARFSMAVIGALKAAETTLDHAICRSTRPLLGLGPKGAMSPTAQCSGWLQVTVDRDAPGYLFHNGGTAGSSSALYIHPERAAAIGILANNGVNGNLWRSAKLNWSNPMHRAHALFAS